MVHIPHSTDCMRMITLNTSISNSFQSSPEKCNLGPITTSCSFSTIYILHSQVAMSLATLPFPPQSTTRRPFRLSLVLAARAAFQKAHFSTDLELLSNRCTPSWTPYTRRARIWAKRLVESSFENQSTDTKHPETPIFVGERESWGERFDTFRHHPGTGASTPQQRLSVKAVRGQPLRPRSIKSQIRSSFPTSQFNLLLLDWDKGRQKQT